MEGFRGGDLGRDALKEKIKSSFLRPEPSHPAQLVFGSLHFTLHGLQLILVITTRAYALSQNGIPDEHLVRSLGVDPSKMDPPFRNESQAPALHGFDSVNCTLLFVP